MTCPLCQKRPTKRACPALRRDICPTCCATKRLVEIACPDDCRYLDSAQKHPAAVIRKQIDKDVTVLMTSMGRLSEQQLQLFFLLQSIILGFKPDGLVRLTDGDVGLATGALAASLETSSRGLIFEESTSSVVAEALRSQLKPIVTEVTKSGGSGAERAVAEVLRGIERGARHEGALAGAEPTGYLELVARVLQQRPPSASEPAKSLIIEP